LAARVASAARRPGAQRVLLLDVDGTLAPIAPTPEDARVPPPTVAALRSLVARGWTVALVSGRPAAQVRELVPVEGVLAFGSHGLEGVWPGEPPRRAAGDRDDRIEQLAEGATALAGDTPGVLVERKPAGLAIHDRRVPAARLAGWRRRLDAWLETQQLDGLERLDGRRVVELRPRGVHKGQVAERLPRRRGAPSPDDSLVAMGDDTTDEDLFRALEGRGLSVRVGRRAQPSLAESRLPSPYSVQRFLSLLADRT